MTKKRKYLDDLKIKERPDLWNKNDKRQTKWKKERQKYGFDERETWSMELSFRLWLYERLKYFKKHAPIDLSFHKFEYNKKERTQEELIDEMIKRLEFYFSKEYNDFDRANIDYVDEVEKIWALVIHVMWW